MYSTTEHVRTARRFIVTTCFRAISHTVRTSGLSVSLSWARADGSASERERGGGEVRCELKARMHLQPKVEATCEHGPTDRAARHSWHRKKGARYAPRTPMAYLVTKRREKLW